MTSQSETQAAPGAIFANALFESALSPERGYQLGLLYMDTYLRQNGFSSLILAGEDVAVEICTVLESSPHWLVVGFYVSADNLFEVERACKLIRTHYPNIKLIVGGPQARVSYLQFLENEIADYACIGDGEDCMLLLMKYLSNTHDAPVDLSDIPALAYVDAGKVKTSKRLYLSLDLDRFPIPERSAYDQRHRNYSHICTSRGCASKCTFCYEGTINKIKRHSVERVISEMKYLHKEHSVRYFTFVDDTFTTDRQKVRLLSEAIGLNFKPHVDACWYCECKPSDLTASPWMAPLMVTNGLIRAQIGSETGNQAILDSYQKGMKVEDTVQSVAQLYNAGVNSIFTNFIVGGALETFDTFEQTCDFASNLLDLAPGTLECAFSFLSPYSGTDIRIHPERYQLSLVDTSFVTASSDSYIFAVPDGMDKDTVLSLGSIFRNLIKSKFESIFRTLDVSIIRRQIYYSRFGIKSNWYDFIMRDPIHFTWASFFLSGYSPIFQPRTDLSMIIPVRTFRMDGVNNNTFDWSMRRKRLKFSNRECRVLELCSGKLDLATMFAMLASEFGETFNQKNIIQFLTECADENLILFRYFGKAPTIDLVFDLPDSMQSRTQPENLVQRNA